MSVLERIDEHIRRYELIEPRGEVLCLVSGGPDSTCLFHALRELGYRVSALHVDYGLRGGESDADARLCVERDRRGRWSASTRAARAEAELRAIRYGQRPDRLRATGHTASDQVETILYRLATSGAARGSSRSARTASCARCCRSGARRPRRSAASASFASAATRRTPGRCAA